jgi:diadenosine tetraphosphate (Ap4A) HIT family hydrolase
MASYILEPTNKYDYGKLYFCKIVKEKIESAKIWEDDKFLAILDKKPNTKGMTLVLTKEHYGSDIFVCQKMFIKDLCRQQKKL